VFNNGALFSTGDGHTAQGDGEVDGTAIETSLTSTFQFFVHKAVHAPWPMAESPTHYISMGVDVDLDTALAISLQEAVNYTKVVHGRIPKAVFKHVPDYWAG
jgi:acetamidase/formamidase